MPAPAARVEARVERLRELARKIDSYAEPVHHVAANLGTDVHGAPAWKGPSAHRYTTDLTGWQTAATGLARDLRDTAGRLRRAADQLEHTLPI